MTWTDYIPVQVQSQYVSLMVLMPELLSCNKTDVERPFCLYSLFTHGWWHSKECVTSAYQMQELETRDKLKHAILGNGSAYQQHNCVGRQRWCMWLKVVPTRNSVSHSWWVPFLATLWGSLDSKHWSPQFDRADEAVLWCLYLGAISKVSDSKGASSAYIHKA